MNTLKASIVVSVFNEQEVIQSFANRLFEVLGLSDFDYEVLFVNDGSSDDTELILENIRQHQSDFSVKVINFTHNFGHEAAMSAGIDHAQGNVVICLDSDLQHPPQLIPAMIKEFKKGNHIVLMKRTSREDAGILSSFFSKYFYLILNSISSYRLEPNASDFFLISRKIVTNLKNHYNNESTRFLRGYIQTLGYQQTFIDYVAPPREAGETKYSFRKLLFFSLSAISSLSTLPLHLGIIFGVLFSFISLIVGLYSIAMKFFGNSPPGYTTIVVLITFLFTIQFFLIGFIGIYISHIFNKLKKRPLYIVR